MGLVGITSGTLHLGLRQSALHQHGSSATRPGGRGPRGARRGGQRVRSDSRRRRRLRDRFHDGSGGGHAQGGNADPYRAPRRARVEWPARARGSDHRAGRRRHDPRHRARPRNCGAACELGERRAHEWPRTLRRGAARGRDGDRAGTEAAHRVVGMARAHRGRHTNRSTRAGTRRARSARRTHRRLQLRLGARTTRQILRVAHRRRTSRAALSRGSRSPGTDATSASFARAHLLYGEWLRRRGQRVDARAELRTAQESFAAMGMEAFADRAGREAVATGEKVRSRTVDAQPVLTPQEAQIAQRTTASPTLRSGHDCSSARGRSSGTSARSSQNSM